MPLDLVSVSAFSLRIAEIVSKHEGWIYSWGRSSSHNSDVGGKEASRHVSWTAVDAGFDSLEERDAAYDECYKNGLHGYKKEFNHEQTGKRVFGFHMQDTPGEAP